MLSVRQLIPSGHQSTLARHIRTLAGQRSAHLKYFKLHRAQEFFDFLLQRTNIWGSTSCDQEQRFYNFLWLGRIPRYLYDWCHFNDQTSDLVKRLQKGHSRNRGHFLPTQIQQRIGRRGITEWWIEWRKAGGWDRRGIYFRWRVQWSFTSVQWVSNFCFPFINNKGSLNYLIDGRVMKIGNTGKK